MVCLGTYIESFTGSFPSEQIIKMITVLKFLRRPTIKDGPDSNCPKYTKAQVILSFKKPIVRDRAMFVWA